MRQSWGVVSRYLAQNFPFERVFDQLQKVWSHAGVTKARKLQIYSMCVISKLLYSLDSLWLVSHECRRLDACHYRCLRRLLRIVPSFISRISNAEVLRTAEMRPLSTMLRDRQMALYQRVVGMNESSSLRRLVCDSQGRPRVWEVRRRRGRPRQRWTQAVYELLQQTIVYARVQK